MIFGADIDKNLIKYWVRSLGPVYSKPDTTSWTNSPEFPLDWKRDVCQDLSKLWIMDASTNLKDHPTGLGVKGIPCHVIFANPVDVIDTAEDKRILFSLNIRLSVNCGLNIKPQIWRCCRERWGRCACTLRLSWVTSMSKWSGGPWQVGWGVGTLKRQISA